MRNHNQIKRHEHNYQRYDINELEYLTIGTGNRDGPDGEDGNLYKLGTKESKGFERLYCQDDENGFVIMDLKIDDPLQRNVNGWFMSNSEEILDKFALRD